MSAQTEYVARVNQWRDSYNPLRGFTIARAVSLLEQGQRGEFADLQWTYHFIEMTDADLLALVERRVGALLEMDWGIKTVSDEVSGWDEALAEDQTAALRQAYERVENLYEAIEHLQTAVFRGYAHVYPLLDKAGEVVRLEPLQQWNFVRQGFSGPWYWNPEAKSCGWATLPAADKLDETEWIIRIVRRPVNRVGVVKFTRSSLSDKDWDAYIEIYGIPPAFIIGPPGVGADAAEYKTQAERAAVGGSGYLPNGADVKFANEARAVQPFELRLDYLTKRLVLAGTGGLLTMLTESGSGTLAGGAHMEAFRMLARSDATRISELFQRWLDRRVLDRAFHGKPRLAYFEIASKKERDVGEVVTQINTLAAAGYQVDPEQVAEDTGYRVTLKPQPAPPPFPGQTVLNREHAPAGEVVAVESQPDLVEAALEQEMAARPQAMRPVAEWLAELERIAQDKTLSNEDAAARIEALIQSAPELLGKIDLEALAKVREAALGAAVVTALQETAGTGAANA